jgi:diguanylate cyclase (GGDEF)-like protein
MATERRGNRPPNEPEGQRNVVIPFPERNKPKIIKPKIQAPQPESHFIIQDIESFDAMSWVPEEIRQEEDKEKKSFLLTEFLRTAYRTQLRSLERSKARGKDPLDMDPEEFLQTQELAIDLSAPGAMELAETKWTLQQAEQERGRNRLTGLLNGEAVGQIFMQEIKKSREAGNGHTVVVRFDADSFKKINDEYSHEEGDKILKAIGTALERSSRPTDYPLHYSGDEFGLLLTNVHPSEGKTLEETVEDIIRRQIRAVEEIIRPDGMPQTLSAGYKIVGKDEHGYFPHFDEEADDAAKVAKSMKFLEGTTLGSDRIINYANRLEALLQVNPGEYAASKLQGAMERSVVEIRAALQEKMNDGSVTPKDIRHFETMVQDLLEMVRNSIGKGRKEDVA